MDATQIKFREGDERFPTFEEVEAEYLAQLLEAAGGSPKRAAEISGIHRNSIRRKADRFGLLALADSREEN